MKFYFTILQALESLSNVLFCTICCIQMRMHMSSRLHVHVCGRGRKLLSANAHILMMMMPPSAIAGNRVNRECYMQVHERGCTTPALVRFSVTGF